MGQELEIEFKNMLTLEDYELIKQYYFKQSEPFKQTNYYIDTHNHDIMSQKWPYEYVKRIIIMK